MSGFPHLSKSPKLMSEPVKPLGFRVAGVANRIALVLYLPDVIGKPGGFGVVGVGFGEITRKTIRIAIFTENCNIATLGKIVD